MNLVGGVAQLTTTNLGAGAADHHRDLLRQLDPGVKLADGDAHPAAGGLDQPAAGMLTSSRNAARSGDIVTFTYTAIGNVGQQPPSGTVTFFDTYTDNSGRPTGTSTRQIGNVQNLIGSMASVDTSTLLPGTHIITARYDPYPGDLVYSSSTTTISPVQIILTPTTTQFFSTRRSTRRRATRRSRWARP